MTSKLRKIKMIKTMRVLVVLGMTVTTLAGGGMRANAMNLLIAMGATDATQIVQAAIDQNAKEASKIEPAAGRPAEEHKIEQITE